MRTSRALLGTGLIVGGGVAIIGVFIPGGGLGWFLHTPTGQLGPALALALLAAGAVVQRLERSEMETRALRTVPTDIEQIPARSAGLAGSLEHARRHRDQAL